MPKKKIGLDLARKHNFSGGVHKLDKFRLILRKPRNGYRKARRTRLKMQKDKIVNQRNEA